MKNSSRTITFLLLTSGMMMVALTVQSIFFPPQVEIKNGAKQDVADVAEGDTKDEKSTDVKLADNQSGTESETASTTGDAEATENASDAEVGAAGADESEDENSPTQPALITTIGSLDPSSPDRMLVTLNSLGGTIKRIEPNARDRKGEYLYRDLDHLGGYMGELELSNVPKGALVNVVGAGTPAAVAGIQAGDTISKIDGEPVINADGVKASLEKREIGTVAKVDLIREDATELTVDVTLTEKPIEFTRPEPDTLDPGYVFPESFELTLRQAAGENPWREIEEGLRKDNWTTEVNTNAAGERLVEFSVVIPPQKLEPFDIKGPLKVVKQFWLPTTPADSADDYDTRHWHIGFKLSIINQSSEATKVGYQLNGPTGMPTEGWWYQMKINGSGSFTGLAGARDVVGKSANGNYVFEGAPGLTSNLRKSRERQAKKYIVDPFDPPEYQEVEYLGVDTQYFHISLMPVNGEEDAAFRCYSAMAWPTTKVLPKNKKLDKLVDCTTAMFVEVDLEPNATYQQEFEIFAGPKDPDLLESYGLGENRAFGWFAMFSKPLCWLLEKLYYLTFQISYGIPIIILTVMVRCLMIPISRKAAMNAQMMQFLAPEMKKIKEQYPDDLQKQSLAQRALFKKYDYKPLGGCLMGVIQIPIFIGLYRGLSVDIALRDQPLIPGIEWASNLAAPDQLLDWSSWMPAFLAGETGWLGPYLNVLPLITVVLFVINTKLFTPPPTDENQAMMQKVMTFMMFFMGFLFYKVPAALCLYFITSSIWGIFERLLLPKPKLDTSKLDPVGDLDLGSTPTESVADQLSNKKELDDRKRRQKERQKRLKDR